MKCVDECAVCALVFVMKLLPLICGLGIASTVLAADGVRSGHASAKWLVQQESVKPGETFMTVVQLEVDRDWHVYWTNPGDAGMPTSVSLTTPKGWVSKGLLHPVPGKFLTGELHGFGHGGVVDYGLPFEVPEGFEGDGVLKAEVSWLTCNNEACIPGNATLELVLKGGVIQGAHVAEKTVKNAFANLPADAAEKVILTATGVGDLWKLTLRGAGALGFDPAAAQLFVETPQVVAPSAEVKFVKSGDHWTADCPKSAYAPKSLEKLAILLASEEKKQAVRIEAKLSE